MRRSKIGLLLVLILFFSTLLVSACSSKSTLEADMISLEQTSYVYDGIEKKPSVTVTFDKTVISSAKYSVTYENNIEVGEASVIVTMNVDCKTLTGSVTVHFTITEAELVEIGEMSKTEFGKEKITIENRKLISAESKKEFRMKGISNGVVEGITEACYAEETLNNLVRDGFNTIRLNLSVATVFDLKTKEFRNSELDKLKVLCERAYKAGIYIIIDLHTLQGFDIGFVSYNQKNEADNYWYDYPIDDKYCVIKEGGSEYAGFVIKFWGKIAETLNGYKSVLAYELMNEPHIMWEKSQQAVFNEYERVLQESINSIRKYDKDTIVSIQKILNYIDTNYGWTEPTVGFYPNIKDDKILLDSAHVYPDAVGLQRSGVVNMTLATGAERAKEPNAYANEGGDCTSRYITCDYTEGAYKTYSVTTTANSPKLIGWNAISVYNNTSANATLTADNFKIIKINADGSETNIISLSSKDAEEKKNIYYYGDTLGKPINLNSDGSYFFKTISGEYSGELINDLAIGLLKGETIRIEIDIKLEGVSDDAKMEVFYQFHDVTPNEFGQSLVTGTEQLEDWIKLQDSYSAMYGSPLYWGEFAITAPHINNYTKYKEYIQDFVKLGKKYNLNWIWFGMFSYIDNSDNGFGAYLSGKLGDKWIDGQLATEESKRKSMWEYILPTLLN